MRKHSWQRYAVTAAALIAAALLVWWGAMAVVRDVHATSAI
ncbi:hypothetical protein [Streptomyces sp. NRRL S-237]|nr:hypothetical protein [Streptomyces sp. NRRL S-237]